MSQAQEQARIKGNMATKWLGYVACTKQKNKEGTTCLASNYDRMQLKRQRCRAIFRNYHSSSLQPRGVKKKDKWPRRLKYAQVARTDVEKKELFAHGVNWGSGHRDESLSSVNKSMVVSIIAKTFLKNLTRIKRASSYGLSHVTDAESSF